MRFTKAQKSMRLALLIHGHRYFMGHESRTARSLVKKLPHLYKIEWSEANTNAGKIILSGFEEKK